MSIINEKVTINVGSQQVSYYKKLGYKDVKFRNKLIVDTKDLPVKSMVKVNVICDLCDSINNIRYQDYNKLIKKHGDYYCKNCKSQRIKETCMSIYNVDNVSKIPEVKEKRINTFVSNYGEVHPMKCTVVKNGMMKTHIDNFGCHYSQTKKHRDFMHDYIINRYGKNNSFLNIETMLDVYGVEHPCKSIEIMNRRNITNLSRYDNICSLHGELQKIKTANTLISKHGESTPFKCKSVKEKIKDHFMINYGVDNPSKVPEIHRSKMKTAFKVNKYEDVSYQGSYEKDFLINYYEKLDIQEGISLNYKHSGKNRIYHSDFYIPKYNLIIEIKSSYFYFLEESKNIAKKKACLDSGYNFIFIIDKDYQGLSEYI